jgi:outer membrane protein TolC
MPGVPYSAAYGRECLNANAHPYDMLVANTAMILSGYPDTADPIDVLTDTADWWQHMVEDTLVRLRKTREQFNLDVRQAARTMDEAEENFDG